MKKIKFDFLSSGNSAKGLAALLCLAFAAFLAISSQGPPSAVPADAPPTEFSSGRAMNDLRVITRKSHPIGTPAEAEVRDYLFARLSALGVTPEIQQTTVVNRTSLPYRVGTVRNIMARLPGTASGKAILLAGHYDSVPSSFGASDDGAAVVAMLETLRALKAGPPLKNDVIFLFTDGEEVGLLGAGGFVKEHPWMQDVGLVLNFEARGYSGPSIMFETSKQNGWLIKQFAAAASRPVASSLAYEVYRLLPNDTDLSVFKEANLNGLNFAFIEGVTHYHSALDNIENIDERSLQHHGSYTLALTRHFGNLSFENTKEANAVYFDLFGRVLVHYPGSWATILTALTILLFVGVVILGFKRGLLSVSGISFGFLSFLLCLGGAAGVAALLWRGLSLLHADYSSMPRGVPYNGNLYLLAFLALAIGIATAIFALLRKRVSTPNLATGTLLCWVLLLLLVSFYVPGASFLLMWPLLFSLIGLGLFFHYGEDDTVSTNLFIALTLCAIPGAVLLAPAIYHTSAALPLSMSWVVTLLAVLGVGLFIPHLRMLAGRDGWLIPLAASLCCVVLIVIGGFASGYDTKHPATTNVFYVLDADTGEAVWASGDEKLNDWTAQLFSNSTERRSLAERLPLATNGFFQHSAPSEALAAPEITLLSEGSNDGARTLRLHVKSPRQANIISLYIDASAKVRGATIDGKFVNFSPATAQGKSSSPWSIRYFAFPPEGIELTLDIMSDKPVQIRAVDQTDGLPAFSPTNSRPENLMPSPKPFSDSTLVSKSFTF
jgi:hypothetical protein